ncbi:hypothetical protein ACY05_00585 [Sterolibacterium denitrificans]|uniref:Uncharacterized protein n=2 Tax=Sterolibacterium denitrificans TaxID=157592 RepID=A0A656Z802_9PROT|nr:hypothetical protein [Sterolibacterium denitrificans]KYC29112.1 hypothetical protein ACY05_00585 [Sterolibacterium denitrificans]
MKRGQGQKICGHLPSFAVPPAPTFGELAFFRKLGTPPRPTKAIAGAKTAPPKPAPSPPRRFDALANADIISNSPIYDLNDPADRARIAKEAQMGYITLATMPTSPSGGFISEMSPYRLTKEWKQ